MEYYNTNIQLDKDVINDMFAEFKSDTKLLVFGLGYDSNMWYHGNNMNTYFIENKQNFIDINSSIPAKNIIKYDYKNIRVSNSFNLTESDLDVYSLPDSLTNLGKFDIILIDGPEGYTNNKPGRLLPCYWTYKYLSKKGTIIYIDDSKRTLENYCINKFFKDNIVKEFNERNGCTKIII